MSRCILILICNFRNFSRLWYYENVLSFLVSHLVIIIYSLFILMRRRPLLSCTVADRFALHFCSFSWGCWGLCEPEMFRWHSVVIPHVSLALSLCLSSASHCPNPDSNSLYFLHHGTVNCTKSNLVGSVCFFYCDANYELKGHKSSSCLQDETWSSPNKPDCVGTLRK